MSPASAEITKLAINCFITTKVISQKVFIQLFCKSQFPHKCVNLSFNITNINNKLTNFGGN